MVSARGHGPATIDFGLHTMVARGFLSDANWGVSLDSVVRIGECGNKNTCDLSTLEDLACDNAKRGGKDIVARAWTVNGDDVHGDPKSAAGVHDPKWTQCDKP